MLYSAIYEQVFNGMVNNMTDYLNNNGLRTMVLGISGGIDSTVTAFVCYEVARKSNGKFKFLGVSLPSNTNAESENEIAKELLILCDEGIVHSIEAEFIAIKTAFNESTVIPMNSLQEGNIKARIRMMYLYNLASMNRGIVLDTDNLTEFSLGFKTRHGDEGDVNVGIARLWKHDIYELANYICENFKGEISDKLINALQKSIDATPTDGNGVRSGGDLAQIAPGYTYNNVDEVLDVIVNYHNDEIDTDNFNTRMKALKQKYSEDMVEGIYQRYKRNEFKRLPSPIIL